HMPLVIVNRGTTRADAAATVKIDTGTSEALAALATALTPR
ncbi:MAG TPA: NAD-dependent deacetylase, partial [Microbacterium sp.]|nr:NAD-dependent deacetylase [Microbacterium sp.]